MRAPVGDGNAHLDVEENVPDASTSSPVAQRSQTVDNLRRSRRFHRLTERLHGLGPRPVGEALLEVAAARDVVGARHWSPLPIGGAA
jgi:hypothetical protein